MPCPRIDPHLAWFALDIAIWLAVLAWQQKKRKPVKTELTSGAWVEHRPVQDLKAKDKDAVSLSVKMAIPITEEGEIDRSQGLLMTGAMEIAARNAAMSRVITGWSYDFPVPYFEAGEVHNAESIGEIPLDDINEIIELIAPYVTKLRQRADPKGAITAASNGSSKASQNSSRQG